MTRPDPSLRQQSGVRTFLRIGGPILLVIGGLMTIAAFASFFTAFGTGSMPQNFWMGFVGLPLLAIGWAMTQAGYLGPASRYVAGEVTDTVVDTLGALGVGRPTVICAVCGEENREDSRFCDGCGKPLSRVCPSCAAQNDPDARFCNACGHTLPG
jgi:hypothetical protein